MESMYLPGNVPQAAEEIGGGMVVPSLSLDWLNHNASHRFALLPPLNNEVLHLQDTTRLA